MLQQLIELVKNNSGLLKHPSITSERQGEAATLAGTSIFEGIKTVLAGGGVASVMDFFKGGQSDMLSSPVVKEVSGNFVQKFTDKFSMSSPEASSLAGSFIPGIMTQLISKANSSDGTFDIQSMFNEMSDGKTSKMNISSIFSKIKSGMDRDNDGDVDLQDLKSIFTGQDGVVDKIKNMFK